MKKLTIKCPKCNSIDLKMKNNLYLCQNCFFEFENKKKKFYKRYKNTIFFGSYPQTKVSDKKLIRTLNSLSKKSLPSSNCNNWIDYEYFINQKIEPFMFYKDIVFGNEKYRGVCFKKYRPYLTNTLTFTETSYQKQNGYLKNKVYWFKYEPIKWTIAKQEDSNTILVSKSILDSQKFFNSWNERKIDNNTVYPNNYEYSDIRIWLNKNFYDTAFNDLQKQIIIKDCVDNNLSSVQEKTNKYVCNNTNDNIFLLSIKECNNYFVDNNSRKKLGTDYAKCQGLCVACKKYSDWILRSPTSYSDRKVHSVVSFGEISNSYYVSNIVRGILPALKIKL